jgi:hypothetical protein
LFSPDTLGFKNSNRPKRLFAQRNMALSGYVIAKHIQPSNVLSFYKLKEVYLKIDEQELLRALD